MLPVKTLLTTLFVAGSAFALPEAVPDTIENVVREAAPVAEAAPEPATLDKRACRCIRVSNPGLYCGYCYSGTIVTSGRINNHVYWCNTAGGCEDLGVRNSCTAKDGPCDGRDSG
ncbi:hypothetical protein COCSADRAFT_170346 [Bipolaris sorokiniana ND90Pr]|uniref:Uncharacterized protein n=1 Tax=Cochliobolus sativus (strain ND90Pr / ATCC 201652) TaxID=665912 RepID=M2TAI3_COCSN|nr:uncharacterized protein COCSADRAFT_170346 [Bipolaris sorokiniana ND90Pr]EMD65912.1 hypothetical protein COCSADRAFT_170346 [Bipolaris sorokiniana ND90Pr]